MVIIILATFNLLVMEKTKDDLLLMLKSYQESYQIQMDAITKLESKLESFLYSNVTQVSLRANGIDSLKKQIQIRSEGLRELDEKILNINLRLRNEETV